MKRQFAVVSMLFLLACQDSGTGPIPQGQPSNAIIDGRHGGNSHFYWLNPQSAMPPTASFGGTPNANLFPVVRICRWNGSACVGGDVAVLAVTDGTLQAKPTYYEGQWKAFQAAPLQNELFRARVFLGNLEIGARDMKFLGRTDYGNVSADNPDFAPILWYANAYTGPNAFGVHTIRFRAEDGVLREALGLGDEECTDCSEGSVSPNETETVVVETPSQDAAAVFEPGSVSQPINVLVEKLDVPCLPTDAQQYPACYRFVAEPDIEFDIPATVEVCVEQIDNFAEDQVQLYKVKERRVENEWVPTGPVEALENVPDRFIDCGEPVIIGAIGRKYPELAKGLRTVTKPLAKVFGARVAYATDEGRGGRASEFSRVGWARAVNISKQSGDNQSGDVGSALNPAVVHITPFHFDHDHEGTPPARGVPVTYRLFGPSGVAGDAQNATSDDDGQVSIPLTLGQTPGIYRLEVSAPGTNLADRNAETGELEPRAVPIVSFFATAQGVSGRVLVMSGGFARTTASVRDGLAAQLPTVTFEAFDANEELPSLEYLQSFNAVLLYEEGLFTNAQAVGNLVAQYYLGGGNVIIATFYLQERSDNTQFNRPGWGDLELYDPFICPAEGVCDSQYANDSLDPRSVVPHELTAGLNSLTAFYQGGVAAKMGTTVVARWSSGSPLIGYRFGPSGQRMLGVSVYPGHLSFGVVTGDFATLGRNAVMWALQGPPPGVFGRGFVSLRSTPSMFAAYAAPATSAPNTGPWKLPNGTIDSKLMSAPSTAGNR